MTDKLIKQVDNFFEYEKNDSLIEFKLNYKNFVSNNRLSANKRLLKLYKSYLDDSLRLYTEEEDPRFKMQSKEMTKKLKKIVSYLENEQKILLLQKNYRDKKIKKKKKNKFKSNRVNEYFLSATEDLSIYPFPKSLNIFIQSLKTKEIDDNLVKQATYIKDYFLENSLNQEMIDSVNYINTIINNRIKQFDKDDSRRKILKSILNDFKYISNINVTEKEKEDNLFYVIDYFLDKEDYYLYFKELIKYIPKMINVRYNGKHILNYILEKFILNYKMMLLDKNSNYINKDYLKSIYLLFLRHSNLSISRSELKELDKMLIEFMNFVNKNITSSKRQNVVKMDLKDMYTDKMYNPKNRDLLNEIDNYKLNSQINSIEGNLSRTFNKIDLTHEDTIMLSSPYAAFSIDDNKLKIHVLDLYNVIINYTELNKYMYNLMANSEKDRDIINLIYMEEGRVYPTITYEIDETLNIYKSRILVKSKDEIKLKPYLDMTNEESIEGATSKLEKLLNYNVMNYFEDNHLPFVYSGRIKNDLEKQKILNDLTYILSKIEKEDFYKIYNALYNYHDKFHYEMSPFNGRYKLNIMEPINYIGLTIQRIIHEVVLETRNSEDEKERVIKKYEEELKTLVATINYYNDYVDKEVLKANKGKMKKRQKMFF